MAMRSPIRASMLAVGLAGGALALASPLRALVKRRLPPPGTGPSEEVRRNGWFRLDFAARGEDGRRAFGLVKDKGDPGNVVTVKCVCEAALALAVDGPRLPGGPTRGRRPHTGHRVGSGARGAAPGARDDARGRRRPSERRAGTLSGRY
jgi:hypothetical protein